MGIGDIIFDNGEYTQAADWCNTHGCRIVDISEPGGVRKFRIEAADTAEDTQPHDDGGAQ